MRKQRGMFVVIDGPSASGKDLLIDSLIEELKARGERPFLLSEEVLDENRREVLAAREKGRSLGGSGDREMAEVLVEHRSDIYRRFMSPCLDNGEVIVANRGEPATLTYQTARKELTMEAVWEMHRRKGVQIPDLVVLTVCSAELALRREENDRITSSVRGEREAGRGLSGKVTHEAGASREERLRRRESIHEQYEATREFLEGRGVRVLYLDTEKMTVVEEARAILNFIPTGGDSKF